MSDIQPIRANSTEGGEVYRLLVMLHSMAGSLANEPKKHFQLARTNSDETFGPITTVWTNGIVDIEARTWRDIGYHEYSLKAVSKDGDE